MSALTAQSVISFLRAHYEMADSDGDIAVFIRAAINQKAGGTDEAQGRYNSFVSEGCQSLPHFVIDDYRDKTGHHDVSLV